MINVWFWLKKESSLYSIKYVSSDHQKRNSILIIFFCFIYYFIYYVKFFIWMVSIYQKNFIVLSWNLMNKWASLPQKHKSNKILYRLKYEDVLYYRVVCRQTSYAKNSIVNLDQKVESLFIYVEIIYLQYCKFFSIFDFNFSMGKNSKIW